MKTLLYSIFTALLFLHPGAIRAGVAVDPATGFDTVMDSKPVTLFTLRNHNGMTARITNYGAIIVDLQVPDRNGELRNVVVGYPTLADYFDPQNNFAAAVIGPYANRIAGGIFTLDGITYRLPVNRDGNTIHGGAANFAKKVWDVKAMYTVDGETTLELFYLSPEGIYGFPGNLRVTVRYTVTRNNALRIEYSATTDAPTVINLTNHAYFNLHGQHRRSINSHVLTLAADRYTPTVAGLIPTGEIAAVEGTALDFRTPMEIGTRMFDDDPVFSYRNGYDHNFVINRDVSGTMATAAEVYEPESGIVMTVITDAPGIQLFTGRSRQPQDTAASFYRSALALETQNFPDAPNHPEFPSTVLRPGEIFTQTCIYAFSTKL